LTVNDDRAATTGGDPGRRRLPIQKIAIEVFSIVLGVFLALGVNQWREREAQMDRAEAALANIEQEIRSNLEFLELIHDSNLAAVTALERDDADAHADTSEMTFTPGLQVSQTAWETAQTVGVFAQTDYDRIVELAKIYEIQTVYRALGYQLTQAMMNGVAFAAADGRDWDDGEANPRFTPFFRLLVEAETALMDKYREQLTGFGASAG
jgi:hypothetical protein